MHKPTALLFLMLIFSSFTTSNTNPELDGIWVHQEEDKAKAKTYLIIDGDKIQLYMEAYWSAGYNQYFAGDKLVANGSLIIHVKDYLTISPNTGQVVKYRNCPKYNLQRLIIHDLNAELVQIEIIPGSSIYDSFGFFKDNMMNFQKVEPEVFKGIDPIFYKIPNLLHCKKTMIRDCSGSNQ